MVQLILLLINLVFPNNNITGDSASPIYTINTTENVIGGPVGGNSGQTPPPLVNP